MSDEHTFAAAAEDAYARAREAAARSDEIRQQYPGKFDERGQLKPASQLDMARFRGLPEPLAQIDAAAVELSLQLQEQGHQRIGTAAKRLDRELLADFLDSVDSAITDLADVADSLGPALGYGSAQAVALSEACHCIQEGTVGLHRVVRELDPNLSKQEG